MRVKNSAILVVGLCANAALAAPPVAIANRNSPRQIVAINATLAVSVDQNLISGPSTTSTTSPPSPPPVSNPKQPTGIQSHTTAPSSVGAPQESKAASATTAPGPPRPLPSSSSTLSFSSSYLSHISSTSQVSSSSDATTSATNHLSNSTWSLEYGTSKITTSHSVATLTTSRKLRTTDRFATPPTFSPQIPPSRPPPPPSSSLTTVTVDCPINGATCITPTGDNNGTGPTVTTTCTPLQDDQPFTVFSVVYPSTVTVYGNRSDYASANQLPETPRYCPTILPAASTADSTSIFFGSYPSQTYSFGVSDGDNGETTGSKRPHNEKDSSTRPPLVPTPPPPLPSSQPTVTLITTAKTPYTSFPNDPPQKYSQTWVDPWPGPEVHPTVPPGGGGADPQPYPRPTYRITAGPNQVIINGQTYSNLVPGQTTVVSVDGGHFTILPTAVIGEGGTVTKPAPLATAAAAPTPTSGNVGGLSVTVSGTDAIVGGVTMHVPTDDLTTVIKGQTVIINPTQVAIGPDAFTFNHGRLPRQTDVVIFGGEALTAIGKSVVVIHSTTITYGPNIPGTTEVVDDDTVTIGPIGVVVHGMTIGGPAANATATRYEIVGGATVTKIAPSIAVINGKTFTVGPGTNWITTVIGGETITIGPTGVVVASVTLTYPFGDTNTGTVIPSGTWLNTFPMETNTADGDEDSKGSVLMPSIISTWTAFCIAIGVWIFA